MNPFSPAFYIWRLPAVLGTLATNETIVYLLAIDYPVPILVVPPVRVTRIARTPLCSEVILMIFFTSSGVSVSSYDKINSHAGNSGARHAGAGFLRVAVIG